MQAAVFEAFGEPADVLTVRDVPIPEPGPGEVRVRILASPVNPSDLLTIRGNYGKQPELPAVPGYEGVGVVDTANAGLFGQFLRGKRVAVLNPGTGNWRQFTIVPAKNVIPLSNALTLEQAASFFINPATAFLLSRRIHAVPQGDWLLQSAATSVVGRMIIRLGRKFGFKTLNIVRRPEAAEELRELGADRVVVFREDVDSPEQLRDAVLEATAGNGVRHAIDPVGGATASAIVPCLGELGRLTVYGTLTNSPMCYDPRDLMTRGAEVRGFWLNRYMATQGLLQKLGLVQTLTNLIREGVLATNVFATFPLSEVVAAVRASEVTGRNGKVLLRMDS